MNIYDYIKNIYEKGFTFAKSVETKMMDDFNKLLGMFFQPNLSENITVANNCKKNIISWLLIGVTVSIISYPNILMGITTFFFFMFIAYFYHVVTHVHKNIFSIVHHYHHENNNLFSHFIQVVLELSIPYPFVMFSYFCNISLFNPWIILYFMLFYCSVHNINYSIFKVNGVHRLHHKEVNVNFGPDVCDVLFGTKHNSEDCVENTNHYIPNIIIITGIVLILQYLCKTEWVKDALVLGVINILSLGIILLFFSSIILWNLECKKYNNVIENRLCKRNSETPVKDDREMTPRTGVSLSTQPSDEKKE
jgi:hypothetical protein